MNNDSAVGPMKAVLSSWVKVMWPHKETRDAEWKVVTMPTAETFGGNVK